MTYSEAEELAGKLERAIRGLVDLDVHVTFRGLIGSDGVQTDFFVTLSDPRDLLRTEVCKQYTGVVVKSLLNHREALDSYVRKHLAAYAIQRFGKGNLSVISH